MDPSNKTYSILIVDDDIFLRDLYAESFKKEGFEVRTAADGEEGIESVLQHKPDVIFTGIQMPRFDGFAFMRKLQENADTRTIPVFISSHHGKPIDEDEARKLGAKGFFIRYRVTPQEVLLKIRSYLEGKVIYLVSLDPNKFDAPQLLENAEGKRTKDTVLELSPNPDNPGSFIARFKSRQ